jgi:uncharacterized membrane protein YgaE (UPF0421/DUF939 family)
METNKLIILYKKLNLLSKNSRVAYDTISMVSEIMDAVSGSLRVANAYLCSARDESRHNPNNQKRIETAMIDIKNCLMLLSEFEEIKKRGLINKNLPNGDRPVA